MQLDWIKTGSSITLIINGWHEMLNFSSEEEAEEVEKLAIAAKEGDGFAYDELIEKIKPAEKLLADGKVYKKDGGYYLAGSNIPLQSDVAEKILKYSDSGAPMEGLINFAKLLYANPLKHVREDLYQFIEKNGIIVTSKGYLVLYKKVTKPEGNNIEEGLAEFVGKSITKVKRWKKSPSNYNVYQWEDGSYHLSHLAENPEGYFQGNLRDLYEDLGQEQDDEAMFTDLHSRSTAINLGRPVRMDWMHCDTNPERPCSNGLHAGAIGYVGWFGASNWVLTVLVNPMNIAAVPEADKLRACEYFPVSILEQENGGYKEIEGGYWEDDYLPEEAKMFNEENLDEFLVDNREFDAEIISEEEKIASVIQERIN